MAIPSTLANAIEVFGANMPKGCLGCPRLYRVADGENPVHGGLMELSNQPRLFPNFVDKLKGCGVATRMLDESNFIGEIWLILHVRIGGVGGSALVNLTFQSANYTLPKNSKTKAIVLVRPSSSRETVVIVEDAGFHVGRVRSDMVMDSVPTPDPEGLQGGEAARYRVIATCAVGVARVERH